MSRLQRFSRILLDWWSPDQFDYPWRRTFDPYRILIAELLLHKTDARKVEHIYPEFIRKFPDILDLYQSNIAEIEQLIKEIGLFYRAKRIKKIAEKIVKEFDGNIPDSKKELKALYGVGDYISNAVLCFAFEERVPIVDTNVIRVYERVFNLKSSKSRPRTDKKIWDFAEKILPLEKFVEYNYALLDFASSICRAKNPRCKMCPVNKTCQWQDKNFG